jgi:hypothetical protein
MFKRALFQPALARPAFARPALAQPVFTQPAFTQLAACGRWRSSRCAIGPDRLSLREADGVQRLHVAAGQRLVIQVQQGTLWLTVPGQPQDCVLQAGQRLAIAGPSRLMLGALGPAACAVHLQ